MQMLRKYLAQRGEDLQETPEELTPAQRAAKSMTGAFGSWTGNPKAQEEDESSS